MPSGCFEQTSSTTYPNVLALDYLRRTGQSVPSVEEKARQYIHLGYQRLIGFEVDGGGFDWFGQPPANRTLTAYGLMEFADMARVHDVDLALIERTRRWLLAQRRPDGSWDPERHAPHDAAVRAGDNETTRLATTAYVAWAVFGSGKGDGSAATLDYLLAHRPAEVQDPHILALVCNALLAIDPDGREVGPYLDRLAALKETGDGGKFAWWEQPAGARTTFYGAGRSGSIETTALAALALARGQRHPEAARAALGWLVSQKDARGTWHSTQATVLSLKALLAGTGQPLGGGRERRVEVRLGDGFRRTVVIPADQAEVMQQLDLTPHLRPGPNRLTVTETSGTDSGYQVAFRYHVPGAGPAAGDDALAVDVHYDRTKLSAGQTVHATATVATRAAAPAAMVMLDLPVPAGFAAAAEDFAALAEKGVIARFQAGSRGVLVYLRDLAPGKPFRVDYRLRARTAGKVAAPGARAYEYYDPDRWGESPGTRFTVTARE
jgi:uncharacterized protein YfaS (alpha-2-macroglobulin family)